MSKKIVFKEKYTIKSYSIVLLRRGTTKKVFKKTF